MLAEIEREIYSAASLEEFLAALVAIASPAARRVADAHSSVP